MAEEQVAGGSGQGNGGQGNGGPVHPGEPAPGGSPGTGSNGHTGAKSAVEATDRPAAARGRIGGVWVMLTLFAVVLVFLLVFIVQNNVDTPIRFLGAEGTLPVGVALLFAAALGILLAAIPGYARILQLRRALNKKNVKH
jgi:uncharacterized integral membrane protein